MPFLRQSTSQVIRFGPALDITDGVTEETALTLAQADMRLSKDGGAFAQKNAAGNATHDSDGWYSTTLNATDTNTVGELILNVHQPANMLPVWMRFWVLEEAIYDALFGATAGGFNAAGAVTLASATHTGAVIPTVTTNTDMRGTDGANTVTPPTVAQLNARTLLAADYFDPAADAVATVTDVTNLHASAATSANQTTILNRLGDFAGTGLNTIKGFFQALFRSDAGVSGVNLPAEINELENATAGTYDAATDSQEGIRNTAPLGTAMRGTDSAALASVASEARLSELDAGTAGKAANQVDLIKAETDKIALVSAGAGVLGSVIEEVENRAIPGDLMGIVNDGITAAKIATDALGALELATDAVNEIRDSIISDATPFAGANIATILGRLPAALVGGRMDSNMSAINNNNQAALDLERSADSMPIGAAIAGTLSLTQMTTDLTISVAEQLTGRTVIFASNTTTAALRGQATTITATEVLNGRLTFTALTTIPVVGDTFVII